jgi:hypothetical protein
MAGKLADRNSGVPDPMKTSMVACKLHQLAIEAGVEPFISNSMEEFAEVRNSFRDQAASPMFDPSITAIEGKAFWLGGRNSEGRIVSLQAYRIDYLDTSLAEWAMGWMSGLYMKRQTLMVPKFIAPPHNSRSARITGRVVYHGEIWIDQELRGKKIFEIMPFYGMTLAYLKWYPDAMWGLISNYMATKGYGTRMRYPHLEHSFLRWSVHPEDVPSNEWLVLAEQTDLDYLMAEFDLNMDIKQV